jgi:hypothetical protein
MYEDLLINPKEINPGSCCRMVSNWVKDNKELLEFFLVLKIELLLDIVWKLDTSVLEDIQLQLFPY